MSDDYEPFEGFDYGDVVEHRMNPDVFGVVIGFEGTLITVRLSDSLATARFHECELRPFESDEYEPEPDAPQRADNVTYVDFTKAAALRADTKTKGAA